jgi:dihydrofolate synthase/folylpolyglutamate synthase
MNYPETLHFLYQSLPMFQRVGAVAYKKDLTNTLKLCEVLGHPHRQFPSVHVAGTNGKGSTSHMLAAVLQSAGYKTGLYTSPHLKEFTERIKINGEEISQKFVVDFVEQLRPSIEIIQPSFFEVTVAMAFAYFAQQSVDIAIIEVGLGGRLDSTNIITPQVSVITNISYDHKDLLGDTLPQIAFEKAGIIKAKVPVAISQRQKEVESVFTRRAHETESNIFFAENKFFIEKEENGYSVFRDGRLWLTDLKPDLHGNYQQKNLAGVLLTLDILREQGWKISDQHIRWGIESTTRLTGLKGRWQTLQTRPLLICDTGHNEDGIRHVMAQLQQTKHDQLYMIIGMVRDKDLSSVLSQLPTHAVYYFCQASIPRALPAGELAQQALTFGVKGEVIPNVNEALRKAREIATENDLIFVGGSTFVVAEIDEL